MCIRFRLIVWMGHKGGLRTGGRWWFSGFVAGETTGKVI
jgi:hypothetical protein